MSKISDLDLVSLNTDLPEHGLKKGTIGTVVYVFSYPQEAYEVEFIDDEGETVAQLALFPDQITKYEP